jgi:preprotein translocase subunit SecA
LRKSVNLRAYGQRDPLIEYRREGLAKFRHLQEAIRAKLQEAVPRIVPADPARLDAQEAKVRAAMVAASEGGDESLATEPLVIRGQQYERNDVVIIRKGSESQTMKYKKAEPLLREGWSVVEKVT